MADYRETGSGPNKTDYSASAKEARLLSSPEPIGFCIRRKMITDLVSSIPETLDTDREGIENIHQQMRELLSSDPLTDQQAGILTRWMFYANYPYGETGKKRQEALLKEMIEIRVGDWETIKRICTATPEKEEAFQKATEEAFNTKEPLTTYRGMQLADDDVQKIYQFGLIPQGLWRYGSFNEIAWRRIRYVGLKSAYHSKDLSIWLKSRGKKISDLLDLPLSKGGVLMNHWRVDPDAGLLGGTDTPDSLAISTTPEETKGSAIRYGNYVIKMRIPGERLVGRWAEYGTTDYSVLFFIEPEAIEGIYLVNHREPLADQIEKPIERLEL